MSKSVAKRNALVPISTALPTQFKDLNKNGDPTNTYNNTIDALGMLGLECSHDMFRGTYHVSGHLLALHEVGELSDQANRALRQLIRLNFQFEPNIINMGEASLRKCEMNSFHPIKDYFASIRWDGIPRVDSLLTDYFRAENSPLNSAISRIVLIASVRRILKPGTKFDYITVLDSPEGFNKSTAIETLYGEQNFTDQSILGLSPQKVEEAMRGIWCVENAELEGMRKADQDKMKAQLSRKNDRGRRAWGRMAVNAQRTAVNWGTTNSRDYLRAQSGENRRFLPVTVQGHIDIAKLIADRDEIWAEAVEREATGESISLPEQLWTAARHVRDRRTQTDPWQDELRHISDRAMRHMQAMAKTGQRCPDYEFSIDKAEERIAANYLLGDGCLGIAPKDQTTVHFKRLAGIMHELGWSAPDQMKIGGKNSRGYSRPEPWA